MLRSSLEEKWGLKLESKHMVIPWIMEHASYLLNRFEVSHDGRTAYERCKGKPARAPGVQFGEGVLWRRKPIGNALGKLSLVWQDGDESGIWKTRTIQRKPCGERWSIVNAKYVNGVPWKVREDDDKADGEKLEVIKVSPSDLEAEIKQKEYGDITVPRRWKITKQDLLAHGYSARCEGCKALLAKRLSRAHSEKCRQRLVDAMKGDPRFKEADKMMDEFFESVGQREEEEKEKEGDEGEPFERQRYE